MPHTRRRAPSLSLDPVSAAASAPHPSQPSSSASASPGNGQSHAQQLRLEVLDVTPSSVALAVHTPSARTPGTISIQLDRNPWPHVAHAGTAPDDSDGHDTTVIVYGLDPNRQYEIGLDVDVDPAATRSAASSSRRPSASALDVLHIPDHPLATTGGGAAAYSATSHTSTSVGAASANDSSATVGAPGLPAQGASVAGVTAAAPSHPHDYNSTSDLLPDGPPPPYSPADQQQHQQSGKSASPHGAGAAQASPAEADLVHPHPQPPATEATLRASLKALRASTRSTEQSLLSSLASLRRALDKTAKEDQRARTRIQGLDEAIRKAREAEMDVRGRERDEVEQKLKDTESEEERVRDELEDWREGRREVTLTSASSAAGGGGDGPASAIGAAPGGTVGDEDSPVAPPTTTAATATPTTTTTTTLADLARELDSLNKAIDAATTSKEHTARDVLQAIEREMHSVEAELIALDRDDTGYRMMRNNAGSGSGPGVGVGHGPGTVMLGHPLGGAGAGVAGVVPQVYGHVAPHLQPPGTALAPLGPPDPQTGLIPLVSVMVPSPSTISPGAGASSGGGAGVPAPSGTSDAPSAGGAGGGASSGPFGFRWARVGRGNAATVAAATGKAANSSTSQDRFGRLFRRSGATAAGAAAGEPGQSGTSASVHVTTLPSTANLHATSGLGAGASTGDVSHLVPSQVQLHSHVHGHALGTAIGSSGGDGSGSAPPSPPSERAQAAQQFAHAAQAQALWALAQQQQGGYGPVASGQTQGFAGFAPRQTLGTTTRSRAGSGAGAGGASAPFAATGAGKSASPVPAPAAGGASSTSTPASSASPLAQPVPIALGADSERTSFDTSRDGPGEAVSRADLSSNADDAELDSDRAAEEDPLSSVRTTPTKRRDADATSIASAASGASSGSGTTTGKTSGGGAWGRLGTWSQVVGRAGRKTGKPTVDSGGEGAGDAEPDVEEGEA